VERVFFANLSADPGISLSIRPSANNARGKSLAVEVRATLQGYSLSSRASVLSARRRRSPAFYYPSPAKMTMRAKKCDCKMTFSFGFRENEPTAAEAANGFSCFFL